MCAHSNLTSKPAMWNSQTAELGGSKKRKNVEVKGLRAKKKSEKGGEIDKKKDKDNRKAKDNNGRGKDNKNTEEDSDELVEPPDNNPEEEKFEALVIIPPDGGWGWVIVFACFIILICSDGSMNSYGTFCSWL